MQTTVDQILSKPSIKRHYGTKAQENYPEELIKFERDNLMTNIKILQSVWSDVSFDLIRNNLSVLEIVSLPIKHGHAEWLRENIKIESFLNMVTMHYTKAGCIEINTFIKDTFDQLLKLINMNIKVIAPKRWRLTEFHDHVSYLYLENTTQNNILKTIINPYEVDGYKVSQPENSLNIIIWSKKVKNCVASYEDRIGKSIWIFFIEKDGVPVYTVETNIGKQLNIKQMVSQCNSSVNNEGQQLALKLINEAVKKSSKG